MSAFRVVAHFCDEERAAWGEGEGDGVGDLGFGGGEGDLVVRVEGEDGEGGFGGERREPWERLGGRVGLGGELEGEAGEETQAHAGSVARRRACGDCGSDRGCGDAGNCQGGGGSRHGAMRAAYSALGRRT